jgi:hypothetical protein
MNRKNSSMSATFIVLALIAAEPAPFLFTLNAGISVLLIQSSAASFNLGRTQTDSSISKLSRPLAACRNTDATVIHPETSPKNEIIILSFDPKKPAKMS